MKLSLLIKSETTQEIKENYLCKAEIPTVLNSKHDIRNEGWKMLNILIDMHRLSGFNSLLNFSIFFWFFFCIAMYFSAYMSKKYILEG